MSKNITRSDLAMAVFKDLGLSFFESEKLVDEIFEEICQAFERGEDVKLSSFASFYLHPKKARMGRNPKTGETHEISERLILSFVASQSMKNEIAHTPEEK